MSCLHAWVRELHNCPFLLADLGVTRPHKSNDNPFSESHFKTQKYQPRFPKRFGCTEARTPEVSVARSSFGTIRSITMPELA